MKRILLHFFPLFLLVLLLSSPATALEGARKGLLLWAYTVLPVLLPFMILTGIIASYFPFSNPSVFIFLTGLLCGYPMGAKMDRDFLKNGQITQRDACCLLAVCNHPSPMFLTGYTALEGGKLFPASASFPLIPFLTALYLPVLPLYLLARLYYKEDTMESADLAGSAKDFSHKPDLSLDDHLMSCLVTMERIGLYIMLFSILAFYLFKLPLPGPVWLKPAFMGFLEITTGIHMICEHTSGLPGLLLVAASVSFGGISGIFQTRSVLYERESSGRKNAGLSIRHYIFWKALHSLLSCICLLILWKLYASSFFSS